MDTTNLWQQDKFTKIPNAIIGFILHDCKYLPEARIVLFIARISIGFRGRTKTNKRLDYTDFAKEIGYSVSTVCRMIERLLRAEKIYRFDPEGYHFYYSLQPPDAKSVSVDAKKPTVDEKDHVTGEKMPDKSFALMQRQAPRAPQATSLSTDGYDKGPQHTNLETKHDTAKKALKKDIKESFKEKTAGSAPASAEASASPALENPVSKREPLTAMELAMAKRFYGNDLEEFAHQLRRCGCSDEEIKRYWEETQKTATER